MVFGAEEKEAKSAEIEKAFFSGRDSSEEKYLLKDDSSAIMMLVWIIIHTKGRCLHDFLNDLANAKRKLELGDWRGSCVWREMVKFKKSLRKWGLKENVKKCLQFLMFVLLNDCVEFTICFIVVSWKLPLDIWYCRKKWWNLLPITRHSRCNLSLVYWFKNFKEILIFESPKVDTAKQVFSKMISTDQEIFARFLK